MGVRYEGNTPIYQAPLFANPDAEKLAAIRAHYARERDEMLTLQKRFANDRDAARFFKGEATNLLKFWRAADAWLKWTLGLDGWSPPLTWPTELADYFDQVIGEAT